MRPFKHDRAPLRRTTSIPSSVETRVTVTYRCGHEGETTVRGDPARSRWLDVVRERECLDCVRKREGEADARAVADGKRVALEGSEAQVRWAIGLRQRRAVAWASALPSIIEACNQAGAARERVQALVTDVRAAVGSAMAGQEEWQFESDGETRSYTTREARWWIETRGDTDHDLLGTLCGVEGCTSDWAALVKLATHAVPAAAPAADPLADLGEAW
jgi:hypothetical protein